MTGKDRPVDPVDWEVSQAVRRELERRDVEYQRIGPHKSPGLRALRAELASHLGIGLGTLNDRIQCRYSWRMHEVAKLLAWARDPEAILAAFASPEVLQSNWESRCRPHNYVTQRSLGAMPVVATLTEARELLTRIQDDLHRSELLLADADLPGLAHARMVIGEAEERLERVRHGMTSLSLPRVLHGLVAKHEMDQALAHSEDYDPDFWPVPVPKLRLYADLEEIYGDVWSGELKRTAGKRLSYLVDRGYLRGQGGGYNIERDYERRPKGSLPESGD